MIENQGVISHSEQLKKQVLPKVIYDKSLQQKDVPYTVEFNPALFTELLTSFGVPEGKIEKMKVTFKRKSLLAAGLFNLLTGNITIYTDTWWKEHPKYIKLAQEILEGKRKPKAKTFSNLLVTKRLPTYLDEIKDKDPERGMKTANRLILNAVERKTRSTLLHESKHKIDSSNLPLMLSRLLLYEFVGHSGFVLVPKVVNLVADYLYNIKIPEEQILANPYMFLSALQFGVLGTVLAYEIDPAEISARRFEKQQKFNSRWSEIIKLKPKFDSLSSLY